jgi:hypothetical protein
VADQGDPQPTAPARDRLSSVRGVVLRLVLATVVAAVVSLPLALSWAVNRTDVQQIVGVTPTTFSLTTAGRSELRLGVAGTLFIPQSRGPFGVVATVDGPAVPDVGNGDLASYVTPQMLQLYTGLFHDPGPAITGYLDLLVRQFWHELLTAELFLAALGGLTLFVFDLLLRRGGSGLEPRTSRESLWRGAAVVVVGLVVTSTLAFFQTRPLEAAGDDGRSGGVYSLPSLTGSIAEGTTTNSPLLTSLLAGVVPKVQQLVERQEEQVRVYRATASRGLREQAPLMTGPRPGETAVMMQSDMHCNATMTALQGQVVSMLRERYGAGVPALMAITGDLTTNGTAAEGQCIENEAAEADGAPIAAVTGNHESTVSVTEMKDAGMTVLSGTVKELAGVSVLGDGDPERSELFGGTELRGDETEEQMGARLLAAARDERPDLVLVHEAYAAQAFVGVHSMAEFLDRGGSPTTRYDDGVRDLPASAVFYGHWHRVVQPRVVWNSDGTWTLVMELNTSGGAIADPTIGHFSTPWSPPQQKASFPVVFLNDESGMVTGYQLYVFDVDGRVRVQPRVDIGDATTAVRPGSDGGNARGASRDQ